MERREWIQSAGLALAGLGWNGRLEAGEAAVPAVPYKADNLGLITGTVKSEMQADWPGTLRTLRVLGYRFIEGGVPAGVDPAVFARAVAEAGLECRATGTSMGTLEPQLEAQIATAHALGAGFLVCYWPWLSNAQALTREEVLQAAGRLNKVGRAVRAAGLVFVWHNHDKEFVEIDGRLAFDWLMAETDPEAVNVELDWYWVVKGGADPVALFQQYPGRFPLAHVKDMANNIDRNITCVGQGIIDFPRILAAAPAGGTRHLIVENERTIDGLRCARVSIDYLNTVLPSS